MNIEAYYISFSQAISFVTTIAHFTSFTKKYLPSTFDEKYYFFRARITENCRYDGENRKTVRREKRKGGGGENGLEGGESERGRERKNEIKREQNKDRFSIPI